MKIAQALQADTWVGGVDEHALERGIGGREGALIRLSREWARMGHEVTNFVPTRQPSRIYEGDGFYEFVPYAMAQTCMATFPYYACIAWECPQIFADERVVERNPIRLVEMQCAHVGVPDPLDFDAVAEFATGVVGLSPWHVDFMAHTGVEANFYVLPNGVDLKHYPWDPRSRQHERKFFYSSSPDRGLEHMLEVWPMILKRWPEAELNIAYGLQRWVAPQIWSHRKQAEVAIKIIELLKLPGVNDVGKLSERELADLQCASTMLTYPCDTIGPTETGCITVIEAMAAGAPAAITDCDCLGEEFGEVTIGVTLPFDSYGYMDSIERVLEDEKVYTDLRERGREFAEGRQWCLIAPKWIELFEEQRAGLS